MDTISGETISYQYDRLKRLTSASSTPNAGSPTAAWNEAFQYDGFGNLTGKTLNGTAGAIPVNAATNQLANAYYDLNGNMTSGAGATLTYDESNRLTSAAEVSGGTEYYSYSPDNKQVWRQLPNGNAEYTVYGAHGEKLGVFAMVPGSPYAYPPTTTLTPIRSNIYFAGKMIWSDNVPAYQDRPGTNRANGARFYPFGDEITSTANDREKFATYTRDSYTGLDYANQRYFASTYGRFNTPDPKFNSANPSDPGTINRYSYVAADPINRRDPSGLAFVCAYAGDACDCNDDPFDAACGSPGGGGGDCFLTCSPEPDPTPAPDPGAAPVSTTTQPADPCPGIASQILNTITGSGMPGGKSLLTRVVQQITGSPSAFDEHQEQIDNYRNRLKTLKKDWQSNDCDDPPYGTNLRLQDTSAKTLKKYQNMYQQYVQNIQVGVSAAAAALGLAESIGGFLESLGGAALIPVLF